MTSRSGLRTALDMALDSNADEYIRQSRADGNSLRTIANEVSEILQREVSHEFIRAWIHDIDRAAA